MELKGDGTLSIKDMYRHLYNVKGESIDEGWMILWRLNVPKRVRTFIWLLKQDRLLTNFSKSKKGIGFSMCNLCGNSCETIVHALRDCPNDMHLWGKWFLLEYMVHFSTMI